MRFLRGIIFFLLVFSSSSCNLIEEESRPADTDNSSNDTIEETTGSDEWAKFANGAEYRVMAVQPSDAPQFEMVVVRLEPVQVTFRVHYLPGEALSFDDWQAELGDALVFVNGSFFDEADQALGLVVSDGLSWGRSFTGFGGMFQVDANGLVRVRSLVSEPFAGETMLQALQSFPMLVEPGGLAAPTGDGFEQVARRTIMAQDKQGHILLMSTGLLGLISFYDLQAWLLNSGLEIDVAFALDGGRSTMMKVDGADRFQITIPSFADVPLVLAIYRK